MFKNLKRKTRKGFSLVELVVAILVIAILAVAVFAGGSAVIKKSQVSRTTSDLHNFSIAVESALNETPSVANMKANTVTGAANDLKAIIDAVNNNLAADYQFETDSTGAYVVQTSVTDKNLNITAGTSYVVLKSAKTDAWGNPYYAIFDFGERHCKGQSDFYITIVSAGPNAQTTVGGNIESDDIFLLAQYSDGDVSAAIYNIDDLDTDELCVTNIANAADTTYTLTDVSRTNTVIKGTAATTQLVYAGGADNTTYTAGLLPVNF